MAFPDPSWPTPVAPIRQVLLKVHSRCNLACDYCYVYRHADQSWRDRPVIMARRVVDQAIARISEHVTKHDLSFVGIVLHGGEPLLAGVEAIEYIVRSARERLTSQTRLALGVQTNALLLDEAFLEAFLRHRVRVGVSLDGPAEAHDRHRRHADGRASHAEVASGLARLTGPRHRHLFGGLLCTVDLANDPLDVYEHLVAFEPPEIDFLLPHGTWDAPPPGRPDDQTTPYADWLITIFDRWFDAPAPETRVRLFESVISLLLGGPSGSEVIGLNPVDLVTVEADGSLEQVDVLKVTAPNMAATGYHIAWNSFDEYLEHPGVRARQTGLAGLAEACRGCPVVNVCGGGFYVHRYRSRKGFDNPSIYCPDLFALVTHIANRLLPNLRRGTWQGSTRQEP